LNNGVSAHEADLVPLEEERKVILRLKTGDRDAFMLLYKWYGDLLYRQAILPRLPIVELAEDCLKDTFRTALEKIDQFTLRDRSIFFWLRRIAVNKAMDTYRRHKRDRVIVEVIRHDVSTQPQNSQSPDDGLEQDALRAMIAESLTVLNPRYAQALRLRFLEDLSRESCAEAMEVTLGNFDVILHRAAKAFRQVYPP